MCGHDLLTPSDRDCRLWTWTNSRRSTEEPITRDGRGEGLYDPVLLGVHLRIFHRPIPAYYLVVILEALPSLWPTNPDLSPCRNLNCLALRPILYDNIPMPTSFCLLGSLGAWR